MTLSERLAALVEPWWRDAVERVPEEQLGHREVMRLVAGGLALHRTGHGPPVAELVAASTVLVDRLASLQGPDGLFSSDGNLHSPPDSAFALNDLGIALRLLEGHREGMAEGTAVELEPVRAGLLRIAEAAVPALVVGGIHTPNHRWEVGAALTRLADLDERALPRVRQWLAEGIDVDDDGLYSERSANYAALVSNPCLLVMGDALGHEDLLAIVHRDLHTQLDLTDSDGHVETLFSRRQDQNGTIPLTYFHLQLRRFALAGCATCAAGAATSEPGATAEGWLLVNTLLEVALHPDLAREVETPPTAAVPEDRSRHLPEVGLLVRRHGRRRTVVYGGSDVPHAGRVASGLAGNPTFLRFRSGAAVIRSARLSRVFFGLGPFRAEGLRVDDDGVAHLHERLEARYYQPLPERDHVDDGRYPLTDDGRFTAAMAFPSRPADAVVLTTDIRCQPLSDGLRLQIATTGAATRYALELALGPGEVTGADLHGPDTWVLDGGSAQLRHGDDAITIAVEGPAAGTGPAAAPFYDPGEAFTFLGGTDALTGPRLYLTGTTPGTLTLTLRGH